MMFDDFETTTIGKNSKLVIYYEQGIGDQLFYARFINSLDVDEITLVVNEKLQKFLKNYLNLNVITADEYNSEEYEDYLKINLASILRYLPDEKIWNKQNLNKTAIQQKKNKDRLTIGISWKSRSSDYGDSKSFSVKKLMEKIYDDKTRFINLQYGDVEEDVAELDDKATIFIPDVDLYNDEVVEGALKNQGARPVTRVTQCSFFTS